LGIFEVKIMMEEFNAASDNPYASPMADLTAPVDTDPLLTEAEKIRRKYLSHETSVKSLAGMYWLGVIFMFVSGCISVVRLFTGLGGFQIEHVIFIIFPVLAILFAWIGYGLDKLDARVRVPAAMVSVLGLFAIPIGTIINLYFLYLIFSEKGKLVFSPEYKEIIRQTPHIKYRTPWILWVLLLLLITLIALGVIGAFLTTQRLR
jgi:hypothetical protein